MNIILTVITKSLAKLDLEVDIESIFDSIEEKPNSYVDAMILELITKQHPSVEIREVIL